MFFKRKDPFSSETIGTELVNYVRNNAQQLMYREVFFSFIVVTLPKEAEKKWKAYKEELRSTLILSLIKALENQDTPSGHYQPKIVFLSAEDQDKLSFSGAFEEKASPNGW